MEPWQKAQDTRRSSGKGRQAADEITFLVFVGDLGGRTGRQESRDRAGDAGRAQKAAAENADLRRANEILTTASAFFAARLDPTRR